MGLLRIVIQIHANAHDCIVEQFETFSQVECGLEAKVTKLKPSSSNCLIHTKQFFSANGIACKTLPLHTFLACECRPISGCRLSPLKIMSVNLSQEMISVM